MMKQKSSALLHHTYLLILLVSFFFVFISFHQSLQVLDKEVFKAHEASLAQTEQYCESLISESLAAADQVIYYNPPFWLWDTDMTPEEYERIARTLMVEMLNSLNSIQENFFPLVHRGEEILTHQGQYGIEEFYQLYLLEGEMSLTEWIRWLQVQKSGFRKVSIHSIYEENQSYIAFYFNKLRLQSLTSSSGGVMLFIKTEAIDRMIQKGQWFEGAQFQIADSRRNIIHSWQNSPDSDRQAPSLPDNLILEDRASLIRNGSLYIVLQSDVLDWYYVFSSPLDQYKRPLRSFTRINIILMVIILLTGALLLALYIKKTYLPWKRLEEEVRRNRTELKGMHQMETTLLLEQLMQAKETANTRNRLIQLGVHETGIPRRILAYPAENSRRSESIYRQIDRDSRLDCRRYLYLDCAMVLLTAPPEKGELLLLLEQILVQSRQEYSEPLSFGLSPEFYSIDDLQENNGRAREIMSRNLLMGHSRVNLSEETNDRDFADFSFHLGTELRFINNIRLGEMMKGLEILQAEAEHITRKENLPFPVAKIKMYGLVSLLLNGLGELKREDSSRKMIDSEAVELLYESRTIQELDLAIRKIMKLIEGQHLSETPDSLRQILKYIDGNFTTPDLSVGRIADIFGFSISSLSTQFKKNYGIGILEHIQKKRLNKAKEMITSRKDMPLKDIGRICGFSSPLHFNRTFHRYEGVSPNKYRELNNQ